MCKYVSRLYSKTPVVRRFLQLIRSLKTDLHGIQYSVPYLSGTVSLISGISANTLYELSFFMLRHWPWDLFLSPPLFFPEVFTRTFDAFALLFSLYTYFRLWLTQVAFIIWNIASLTGAYAIRLQCLSLQKVSRLHLLWCTTGRLSARYISFQYASVGK